MAQDRQYYKNLAKTYANDPNMLSQQVTSYANQQGHTPDYLRSLFPNDPNLSAGLFSSYAASQGDTFTTANTATGGPEATNYNSGNFQSPTAPINYAAQQGNPYMPELAPDALAPTPAQPQQYTPNASGGGQNYPAPISTGGPPAAYANGANPGVMAEDPGFFDYPTKIPGTPDFYAGALQQGEANREAAYDTSRLQSPDQYNPFGQQQVTYGPDGNPIVNQQFSDPLQDRFNTLNKILSDSYSGTGEGTLFGNLRQPFDESMLSERSVSPTAGGTSDVAEALWEREQPRLERRRSQAENDLLVRGFNPGTEGFDDYMDEVGRSENDFRLGLMGLAGQEQSRLFGLESDLRNQQLGEQQTFRGQPISEYAGLVQALQPQLPQFQGYQGADIEAAPLFPALAAQGDFQLGRYSNSLYGELGTRGIDADKKATNRGALSDIAGAAALYYSDARLKENIVPIGHIGGHKAYRWSWTDEARAIVGDQPEYGVIAQEVAITHPEAITEKGGFLAVDYARL